MAKTQTLGTKLYVETDTPDEYIAVGNITSMPVPGPEKPEIDVTDFDSVAAEFLPGLPDFGSLDFTGWYNDDDTGQALMFDDANDPDAPVRNFRIEFTRQGRSFSFAGFVKRFRPAATDVRGAYTFDASIRVTGAVAAAVIS